MVLQSLQIGSDLIEVVRYDACWKAMKSHLCNCKYGFTLRTFESFEYNFINNLAFPELQLTISIQNPLIQLFYSFQFPNHRVDTKVNLQCRHKLHSTIWNCSNFALETYFAFCCFVTMSFIVELMLCKNGVYFAI